MVLSKASAFVDMTTGLPVVGQALDIKIWLAAFEQMYEKFSNVSLDTVRHSGWNTDIQLLA